MRAGVKMQGVGDVGVAGDRIAGGHVHILRPVRRAHHDQVVRVDRADGADHGFGVRLQRIGPRDVQRLVVDLVDHVVAMAVRARHVLEKGDRLRAVLLGMVRVPVDDHVHVVGDRGVHHGRHALTVRGIGQIAAGRVYAHGGTHDAGVPVFFQPGHGLGVVEALTAPAGVAPEKAVARHAARLAADQHLVAVGGQRCHGALCGSGKQPQACGKRGQGPTQTGFFASHDLSPCNTVQRGPAACHRLCLSRKSAARAPVPSSIPPASSARTRPPSPCPWPCRPVHGSPGRPCPPPPRSPS